MWMSFDQHILYIHSGISFTSTNVICDEIGQVVSNKWHIHYRYYLHQLKCNTSDGTKSLYDVLRTKLWIAGIWTYYRKQEGICSLRTKWFAPMFAVIMTKMPWCCVQRNLHQRCPMTGQPTPYRKISASCWQHGQMHRYIRQELPCWYHTKCVMCKMCGNSYALTHCDPVIPYDDIDLGQHWLRLLLATWLHQAITRTNVVQLLIPNTADILPIVTCMSVLSSKFEWKYVNMLSFACNI